MTLDVVVLKTNKYKIEIKVVNDNIHLGEEFYNRLVQHFLQEFQRKYNVRISPNAITLRRLCWACKRTKQILSSTVKAKSPVFIKPKSFIKK